MTATDRPTTWRDNHGGNRMQRACRSIAGQGAMHHERAGPSSGDCCPRASDAGQDAMHRETPCFLDRARHRIARCSARPHAPERGSVRAIGTMATAPKARQDLMHRERDRRLDRPQTPRTATERGAAAEPHAPIRPPIAAAPSERAGDRHYRRAARTPCTNSRRLFGKTGRGRQHPMSSGQLPDRRRPSSHPERA
jgi:hypothetical protein